MRYYVSDKTIKAIKNGWPMCDVYLPREPTETRRRAIDIEIIVSCHACNTEVVSSEITELPEGDFCNHCLKIHGE